MQHNIEGITQHISSAEEYIVLANAPDGEGGEVKSHLYINGRADKLADLIAQVFNHHPQIFKIMMDRHQPEEVKKIMEILGGNTPDFGEELNEEEGGGEEEEEEPERSGVTTDSTPPVLFSEEDMKSLMTDIGIDLKSGGNNNDGK